MDFTKAFDQANHNTLVKNLEHHGMRGILNKLIKSYLSNRQ